MRRLAASDPKRFYSLQSRAKTLIRTMIVMLVLDCCGVFVDIYRLKVMDRIIAGDELSTLFLDKVDAMFGLVGLAQLLVWITMIIVYLRWKSQAHQNLNSYGLDGLKFNSQSAVYMYFFPIFSLFKPYQAMKEIWQGSDPGSVGAIEEVEEGANKTWAESAVSPILIIWWVLFIIDGSLGNAFWRSTLQNESLENIYTITNVALWSDVFSIVTVLPLFYIVNTITARQDMKNGIVAEMRALNSIKEVSADS